MSYNLIIRRRTKQKHLKLHFNLCELWKWRLNVETQRLYHVSSYFIWCIPRWWGDVKPCQRISSVHWASYWWLVTKTLVVPSRRPSLLMSSSYQVRQSVERQRVSHPLTPGAIMIKLGHHRCCCSDTYTIYPFSSYSTIIRLKCRILHFLRRALYYNVYS